MRCRPTHHLGCCCGLRLRSPAPLQSCSNQLLHLWLWNLPGLQYASSTLNFTAVHAPQRALFYFVGEFQVPVSVSHVHFGESPNHRLDDNNVRQPQQMRRFLVGWRCEMEETLPDRCYPFYESFPGMASLRHRSPQDILAGQAKRSVSQPNFTKAKPVDYSQVKSRCGSANVGHKPGGGTKKVLTAKVDFSNVESRTSSRHGNYAAGGGGVKIVTKPVKVTHVASRVDAGKPIQRRLSDTTSSLGIISTIGLSPTSSLTGEARSKSETSSPDLQRHRIQSQNFTMPLLDHDKVQEAIRKLSVEDSRQTEDGTGPAGKSPSSMRKAARKASAEKAVKLPLGLRRYASSTSALSRSAERPLDIPGTSRKQLTRHTSLDPSRFKQAVARQPALPHRSLSASQTAQGRAPMRKNASTSMLGSRRTGLSMVSPTPSPGNVSHSASELSKVTSEYEDRLGRDWVRGEDGSGHGSCDVSADPDAMSSSALELVDAVLSEPGPLTTGAADGYSKPSDEEFEAENASASASVLSGAQTCSDQPLPPLLSPIEEVNFDWRQGVADGL